jgi:hypothetical protein
MNLSKKFTILILLNFFQLPLLSNKTATFKSKRLIQKALDDGYDKISYDTLRDSILSDRIQYPQRVDDITLALENGRTQFSKKAAQRPFYATQKMNVIHRPVQGLYQAGLTSTILGAVFGCVCLAGLVIGGNDNNSSDLIECARISFAASGIGLVTASGIGHYWGEAHRITMHFDATEFNSKMLEDVISLMNQNDSRFFTSKKIH